MDNTFIKNIRDYVELHRCPKTGIAWIKDGTTGLGHSAHANIDSSGSVSGMKAQGFWNKKDRTVRSHGFIYNIDSYVVGSELDKIAAKNCQCEACIDRRKV